MRCSSRRCVPLAGALLIALMYTGSSFGWTCPGSQNETNNSGNYPLGMPMGGIGGGNFNFLPSGLYNQTWCRVASPATAAPLCIAFQKRGATVFSGNLQNAGSMTTTFTGYWPTVFMTYHQTGMFDSIALECFSPIATGTGIASENKNSSLPIAIYKFTLTNNTAQADTAAIALSNGANSTVIRNAGNRVIGISSSTICVMADTSKLNPADSITCGSATAAFTAGGLLDNGSAGILAKRVIVGPNSSRTITFCVSWTSVTAGYYRNYYTDAQALATYGRDSADILEAMVDNWHNKVLNSNLPDWLKDLTINCLYVYNCMTDWTTATTAGVAGTYGQAESMSSGNYGCNDQAYHGSFGLPLFAPQAEWSQVARMGAAQQTNGLFSHFYSGGSTSSDYRVDVGQKFILETYRSYQMTGNTTQLQARYTNIKNAITGIHGQDTRNADGLTDDSLMNTYDNPYWDSWCIPSKEYENEIYLGALKAATKCALVNGTPADTATYNSYFNTASASFERTNSTTIANSGFWDSSRVSSGGRLGYYSASSNINITKGKAIWDGALAGQWFADLCGLGPLHPEHRIQRALNYIYDAMLDKRDPPCYALMMVYPDANCNGATPTSTYFQNTCVTYSAYPSGDLCAAFGHNLPDIGMRALHSFWNDMYSKYLRVYNIPCKMTLAGNGTDWGIDRYMNSPACFSALFSLTGFSIDVNEKILRIKPSLPTSAQYRMDSLKAAPLMNPLSCGTVDFRRNMTVTPNTQRFVIRFDSPMQFNTFYTKKMLNQTVTVTKPAVGGSPVAATIAVNTADTSECAVTFGSTLTIDSSGVLVVISGTMTGARFAEPAKAPQFDFTVDTKRGTLSYVLSKRTKVDLMLVNARGVSVMHIASEQGAGEHVVRPDWKNLATGVYSAHFRAGDASTVKKLVNLK